MIRSRFDRQFSPARLAVILPAAAESAKSLYNKGRDAEARQNYEQAYDFYKQAYSQKPQDTSYRSSYSGCDSLRVLLMYTADN